MKDNLRFILRINSLSPCYLKIFQCLLIPQHVMAVTIVCVCTALLFFKSSSKCTKIFLFPKNKPYYLLTPRFHTHFVLCINYSHHQLAPISFILLMLTEISREKNHSFTQEYCHPVFSSWVLHYHSALHPDFMIFFI